MKLYTTRDVSGGAAATREDKGLSLQAVNTMTDWTAEEFDQISELEVGVVFEVDGIQVERTA